MRPSAGLLSVRGSLIEHRDGGGDAGLFD